MADYDLFNAPFAFLRPQSAVHPAAHPHWRRFAYGALRLGGSIHIHRTSGEKRGELGDIAGGTATGLRSPVRGNAKIPLGQPI
jgi:hypothetical protein